MKTNGFVIYDAQFLSISRTETSFHGGNKFQIQTPISASIKFDSSDHKNVFIGIKRKQGLLLAKALLKEFKIIRKKRKVVQQRIKV